VLKQRNSLLKSARATKTTGSALATLDAWDSSLVKYGSEIIEARLLLVERLAPHLDLSYKSIASSNNEPSIDVKSSILGARVVEFFDEDDSAEALESAQGLTRAELEEKFHVKLAELRPKELERGLTLIGPQRDDLLFRLGALPVKGYASHGESWSFALALRLASIELLRNETKTGDPILILDDVLPSLMPSVALGWRRWCAITNRFHYGRSKRGCSFVARSQVLWRAKWRNHSTDARSGGITRGPSRRRIQRKARLRAGVLFCDARCRDRPDFT